MNYEDEVGGWRTFLSSPKAEQRGCCHRNNEDGFLLF